KIVVPAPGKVWMRIADDRPVVTVKLVVRLSSKFTGIISDTINIPEFFSSSTLFKSTSGNKIISFLIDTIVNPSKKAAYRIALPQYLRTSQPYHMAWAGSVLNIIAIRK